MRIIIIVITISVLLIATPTYAAEHQQSLFQRTVQGVFCSVAGLWNMNACSGKEQTAPRASLASDLAVAALYGVASEGNTETANPEKNNNGATIAEGQTASNQTIVNRYITQPVIERTLNTREIIRESGITQEQFTVALNELRKEIYNTQASSDDQQSTAIWRAISLSQKIDNLSGATFSSGTITGSPISGNSGSFTTLAASGATTLTGDLTVDTSTLYVDSTNNRVGIGTTTPSKALDVQGQINLDSGDGNTNVVIGINSGNALTTGYGNVFFGPNAGVANTVGYYNTFVGNGAGRDNATGYKNAFFGLNAGLLNTTGRDNTFLGSNAGYYNTEGYLNVFVGRQAGRNNTTGYYNTYVGRRAGYSATSSVSNVMIGFDAGKNETGSNKLYIANNQYTSLIYGEFDNNIVDINGSLGIGDTTPDFRFETNGTSTKGYFGITNSIDGDILTIDTSGNVGIGTTTPSAQLHTTGSVRFATFGAGTLETDASGNLSVSSDVRLKDVAGDFDRSIDDLLGLKPIIYKWSEDSGFDTSTLYAGFSAQNVQENIPEAVGEDRRGFLTLSDRPIVATIVNSVKEIWEVISVLRSRMDSRDAELEARIAALEAQLASASTGTGAVSGGSQAETSSASTIELVGNSPAEIKIGVTYSDLGVIARDGNGNDLSVSITVDGTATTNIEIDTSIDATYSIEYRAQDSSGQVATTTRTVIVGTGVAIEDVGTALPATATTTASTTEAITDNGADQATIPAPEAEQEGQEDSDAAVAPPANDNVATSTLEPDRKRIE